MDGRETLKFERVTERLKSLDKLIPNKFGRPGVSYRYRTPEVLI